MTNPDLFIHFLHFRWTGAGFNASQWNAKNQIEPCGLDRDNIIAAVFVELWLLRMVPETFKTSTATTIILLMPLFHHPPSHPKSCSVSKWTFISAKGYYKFSTAPVIHISAKELQEFQCIRSSRRSWKSSLKIKCNTKVFDKHSDLQHKNCAFLIKYPNLCTFELFQCCYPGWCLLISISNIQLTPSIHSCAMFTECTW